MNIKEDEVCIHINVRREILLSIALMLLPIIGMMYLAPALGKINSVIFSPLVIFIH